MSHPVFLNSAPYRHMPDGSRNEWQAFWADGGPELEANAVLPVLWMALFRLGDIATARLVDDEDIDGGARDDLDEIGDSTYPYLVTSTAEALANFAARRPALLARLGATYLPIVTSFEALIAERYGPFVLMRTSGLPDPADSRPELERSLADLDDLVAAHASEQLAQAADPGAQSGNASGQDGPAATDTPTANSVAAEIAFIHRHPNNNPIHLLAGEGWGTWPPEELKARYSPAPATVATSRREAPAHTKGGPVSQWPGMVVGLASAATYVYTRSIWLTLACFVAVCLVMIVIRRR